MAEIIPSATKNTDPLAPNQSRQYRTVELATSRGIRTTRMREDRIQKRYGKLDYQGREVYARKVKVVEQRRQKDGSTRIRTVEKAVNPRKLRRDYTYVSGEYKRYEPERLQTVTTTTGRQVITTEKELKENFRRKGQKYEVKPGEGRLVAYRIRGEEREYRYQAPQKKYDIPYSGTTYLVEARIYTNNGQQFDVSGYKRFNFSMDSASMDEYLRDRTRQLAYHKFGIHYDEIDDIEIISITPVSVEKVEAA